MTCLPYDRRESGSSGGRVQRLSWDVYADEARGLLDSLQIERAVIMGACMGCAVAVAFAARYPEMTQALVLHWPVGGARYHEMGQDRFARHLAHV